ncbi:MAG TPA: class II aldolase/adducin family protein [Rectinemataceae bacterium]
MGVLYALAALSRRYGADPAWVLAGGGNTSWKTEDSLYIKASGFSLATIGEDGFCSMDRPKLNVIWDKTYPEEKKAREAEALADLMAARSPGEAKRPSVETLLHSLFPQAYVVHTHPSLVNGLTCGMNGEAVFHDNFADIGIWVPLVDPGFVLATAVRDRFLAFCEARGHAPSLLFMQNHGLLVAGDSPEEIDTLSTRVMDRLGKIVREAGAQPKEEAAASDARALGSFAGALGRLAGSDAAILHRSDAAILGFAASEAAFQPIARPFSPDHIVYAGHEYLRVDGESGLGKAWDCYIERNSISPRIVLAACLGAFAIGRAQPAADREAAAKAAGRSLELFVDSCRVAAYSRAFGGPRHMTPESVAFIRNWEAESYRASVSAR